ncbi:caspase family protein [Dactylosporangium sp. NPDC049140]|uniref:caspase, EACC1-associated type n=1 Tax=Dactylosporangium sp. NPDC049140 TaxID=3155647 RepID=UPI0033F3BC07
MTGRTAVLIGISTYESLPPLPGVARQVEELRAVLTDPALGGFTATEAIDPPVEELRSAVEGTFRAAELGDVLLFYFAGHGLVSASSELYLAAADSTADDLERTAFPARRLGDLLDASRASISVIVLDCCYAGRAFESIHMLTAAAGGGSPPPLDAYRQRAVITSATDMEPAHRGATGSLFTSALIGALKGGADLDGDGVIDVAEVYEHATAVLARAGVPQRPALIMKGGGGAPALIRAPGLKLGDVVVPAIFVQAAGGPRAAAQALGLSDPAAVGEPVDPVVARRVDDVRSVIDAAADVWDETVIASWLRSVNDHLGGARPIDVLLQSGPDEVLVALEAEAEGVFA